MAKRGDKRRRKRRRRPRVAEIEGFEFGPLTVERHGRHLFSHLDAEHPDFPEYQRMRDAELAALPQRRDQVYSDLRALLEPHDAFDLVADLWLLNIPKDADTYRESADTGLVAVVELAAAILLERERREGNGDAEVQHQAIAREVNEHLVRLLELQSMQFMLDARLEAAEGGDDLAEIRAEARSHRMVVRGPSYPWQERKTLVDLFAAEHVREIVEAAAGFSIEQALALTNAAENVALDHLAARAARARSFAEELKMQDEQARLGAPVSTEMAALAKQLSGGSTLVRSRRGWPSLWWKGWRMTASLTSRYGRRA